MYLRCVICVRFCSRCRTSPTLRPPGVGGGVSFIAFKERQSRQGIGVVVVMLALVSAGHVRRIAVSGAYGLLRVTWDLRENSASVVWRLCVRRVG